MRSDGYFDNPYFSEDELRCKGEGVLGLYPGFLGELVFLRSVFGLPMTVNSCCRSPEHNVKIGGHPNSLHLTINEKHGTSGSLAIDVDTSSRTPEYREDLIALAKSLGWSVGHGGTFVHLDRRIQIGLPRVDFHY